MTTVRSVKPPAEERRSFRRVSGIRSLTLLHRLIWVLDRWIPDNVSVSLCSVPPVGQARVSTSSVAGKGLTKSWRVVRDLLVELYLHPGSVQSNSQSGTFLARWLVLG